MNFFLTLTNTAKQDLKKLKKSAHLEKSFKAVSKALKLLEDNPRHPGLQTHLYTSLLGPHGEKILEAYAEQHTPAAYRIFFYYGKVRGQIIVFAITPHP